MSPGLLSPKQASCKSCQSGSSKPRSSSFRLTRGRAALKPDCKKKSRRQLSQQTDSMRKWKQRLQLLQQVDEAALKLDFSGGSYSRPNSTRRWKQRQWSLQQANHVGGLSFGSKHGLTGYIFVIQSLLKKENKKIGMVLVRDRQQETGQLWSIKSQNYEVIVCLDSAAIFFVKCLLLNDCEYGRIGIIACSPDIGTPLRGKFGPLQPSKIEIAFWNSRNKNNISLETNLLICSKKIIHMDEKPKQDCNMYYKATINHKFSFN